jgi:hypothetical protein
LVSLSVLDMPWQTIPPVPSGCALKDYLVKRSMERGSREAEISGSLLAEMGFFDRDPRHINVDTLDALLAHALQESRDGLVADMIAACSCSAGSAGECLLGARIQRLAGPGPSGRSEDS